MTFHTSLLNRLSLESLPVSDEQLASFGLIQSTALAPAEIHRPATETWSRLTWRPRGALAEDLGPQFQVEHDCLHIRQVRSITPAGIEQYVSQAYAAGSAIAASICSLSCEETDDMRLLWFVFQRSRTMRGFMTRRFWTPKDLKVVLPGEELVSVLPPGLVSTPRRTIAGWSIETLVEHGRLRAVEEGRTKTTFEEKVAYGLMAAAERNPLKATPEEVNELVRQALFLQEERPPQGVGKTMQRTILTRLRTAVLDRDSMDTDKFAAWLYGGNSYVHKSLQTAHYQETETGVPGLQISKEELSWALQLLGWEAHHMVSLCHAWYARAFTAALANPLNAYERARFDQIQSPQPYLSGLSLPVVWPRHYQLEPILRRLWVDPDNTKDWPILWHMLRSYSQMMLTRRDIDRRAQAMKPELVYRKMLVNYEPDRRRR